MPFVYAIVPGAIQTTNATPLTANDCVWVKPGTRNVGVQAIYVVGRGAGLTAISGITFRLEKWTTTASSTGGTTPAPRDIGAQASKATAGFAVGAVTSGTGGPTLMLSIGCGAAGPGGWVAPNPDSVHVLEGSATQSIDVFSASGTASMNFESSLEITE